MQEIINYLRTVIDETAQIQGWDAKKYLNLQLAGAYQYYLVNVLGEDFILMKPQEDFSILKSKIHMAVVTEKTSFEAALLLETPTPYKIKKLLEEKMAFIAVDKQMYLPFMALQIKQKKAKEIEERDKFTAATQLIFLYILYSDRQEFETDMLAEQLNLSNMTVLRSMSELKRIGVISQTVSGMTGRKKLYYPIEKKEYYHIGKEFLINPIKKIIYVSEIPDGIRLYKAGLTALAEQTMLGESNHIIYASNEKQDYFAKYQVTKTEALTEGLPEIQLMQYDISKLANGEYVDPITLIMSINNKDDRTEIAVEELMEETAWYEE